MNIQITQDDVRPLLSRLRTEVIGTGLILVMGRAAGNAVREHLFELNSERHKFGRNYYAQAARSVSVSQASRGVNISVTQIGIRQRLEGGTIRPRNGSRYLTIPASPEAFAMRAREFNDLDFQLVLDPETGRIRPALVRRLSTPISFSRRKQKDGTIKTTVKAGAVQGGNVMFWLVRKVEQAADPTVLPSERNLVDIAIKAGIARIERIDTKGNN